MGVAGTRITRMNKEDLIYDAILRVENRLDGELKSIKSDVDDLKKFKATFIGYCGGISLLGAYFIESIKNLFR